MDPPQRCCFSAIRPTLEACASCAAGLLRSEAVLRREYRLDRIAWQSAPQSGRSPRTLEVSRLAEASTSPVSGLDFPPGSSAREFFRPCADHKQTTEKPGFLPRARLDAPSCNREHRAPVGTLYRH